MFRGKFYFSVSFSPLLSFHPRLTIAILVAAPIVVDFDFIECFTTTFLRAHSWLNWVDEDDDEHDEVGLKEKPEH